MVVFLLIGKIIKSHEKEMGNYNNGFDAVS
jgi:hypothetical protein